MNKERHCSQAAWKQWEERLLKSLGPYGANVGLPGHRYQCQTPQKMQPDSSGCREMEITVNLWSVSKQTHFCDRLTHWMERRGEDVSHGSKKKKKRMDGCRIGPGFILRDNNNNTFYSRHLSMHPRTLYRT